MRFSSHLSSHLTPEWKKHYIDYEGLKKMVYLMVGERPADDQDGDDRDGDLEGSGVNLLVHFVDQKLQDEFFTLIETQLGGINSFFKAREAEATHKLREYKEQVEILQALRANRRTRNLRSTKNKHSSLKRAVSEFYYSLILLQNFQQLNRTGFRKVLKKHDKLAQSKRGLTYFKDMVCKSYFASKNEVEGLIEKTENLMIDKLEDGNRSKAMNTLRVPPLEKRDVRSHWVTWITGLLMGALAVMALLSIVMYLLYQNKLVNHFSPTFRGLRVGFILWLWFASFATNTFFWRRFGVNNVLIFEFDPRNNLNFVQLFAVSSFIGFLFMIGLFLTLFSAVGGYPEWVGPLVMLGLMAIFFSLPLPVLYHRSRLWLANICRRIFLAPFYYVNFADFWIADQMNSLVIVFLDLEFFWCYMLYGLHVDYSVNCGSVKYGLRPIVAVLPAWFRFAQCLRRYWNTRDAFPHLVNAGKYSTAFFVVFFSSVAVGIKDGSQDFTHQSVAYYFMFLLWVLSAMVSTCYTFTWDIKMDWGLFSGPHKLRKDLIYPNKLFYWFGIVEDLVFRCLWTLNISVGDAGASILDGLYLGTLLGMLEVGRRFIWNFFRVENEHLTNCGQFRVIRDISIHPINPAELALNDEEEGVEPGQRKHVQEVQRKLSQALIELGGKNSSSGSGLRSRRTGLTVVGEYVDLEMLEMDGGSKTDSSGQDKDTPQENNCVSGATGRLRVSVEMEESQDSDKQS